MSGAKQHLLEVLNTTNANQAKLGHIPGGGLAESSSGVMCRNIKNITNKCLTNKPVFTSVTQFCAVIVCEDVSNKVYSFH